MAAEIVALGIPTVGAVAPMVAEVEVDLAAEIAAGSEVVAEVVLPSQAFQLDVTSAETPARFPLSQTEASRFCAATVSEEVTTEENHEVSITNPPLVADSMIEMIDSRTDHVPLVPQVPLL